MGNAYDTKMECDAYAWAKASQPDGCGPQYVGQNLLEAHAWTTGYSKPRCRDPAGPHL